jgi:hypothetical protein
LAAAAPLLRDGKGALRNRIEAATPGLWQELEKEICAAEIGESYRYLQSIGKGDKAAFGFKKGLMGSLSGDTLWFLIPVYQSDPQAPGNAVALEAGTIRAADETGGEKESREDPLAGGGGKATYFFRLMGRKEYAESAASGAPDSRIDEWIRCFNRAMLAVNFRREPIYLSEEKLREPAYRHYRYSLARLPELLMLRGLFIGRVIHRTPDQWRADVDDLLRFNVGSDDDALRWKKGE